MRKRTPFQVVEIYGSFCKWLYNRHGIRIWLWQYIERSKELAELNQTETPGYEFLTIIFATAQTQYGTRRPPSPSDTRILRLD
jgi:hypothetical protein